MKKAAFILLVALFGAAASAQQQPKKFSGKSKLERDVITKNNNPVIKQTQPMYVVDGKVVTHELVNKIDPTEIESITVLKDSSATAAFKSGRKDGVVVIKTKKAVATEQQK